MAGSADARLTANITTKSEYDNYRTWALSVSGGAEAVQASHHAYASYMLGTAALLENEPTFNIDAVAVDEEGSSTSITLNVTIKDDQDAVQAAQERVAALFEATESLRDWVNGRLTPTVVPLDDGEGGAMRFKVTPGDGTAPRAFLRLNLP